MQIEYKCGINEITKGGGHIAFEQERNRYVSSKVFNCLINTSLSLKSS